MLRSEHSPAKTATIWLERTGYTTDSLAILLEYGRKTHPHPDGMVEDPDGELVRLWDEDAGF